MTQVSARKLRDAIVYLCRHYPHPRELSKARLTKMVYLADWRSALTTGRTITGIKWTFNHYGPYVDDVVELAREDPDFEVLDEENMFGAPREVIRVAGDPEPASLTSDERAVLDHVIETTSKLYWNDFIALVYSTYPIRTEPRYSQLDLVALASEYRAKPPTVTTR